MTDPLGSFNFIDDGAGLRLIVNHGGSIEAYRVPGYQVQRLHSQLGWWLANKRMANVSPAEGEPEERPGHHARD